MDFLKKHYEKVLLGVVLLGLAAGAVFLILMIPNERAALRAGDRVRGPALVAGMALGAAGVAAGWQAAKSKANDSVKYVTRRVERRIWTPTLDWRNAANGYE